MKVRVLQKIWQQNLYNHHHSWTGCQKATVGATSHAHPCVLLNWGFGVSYSMALVCPFAMSPPTSWWTYARWWCPNADSLVFRSGRKFSHKNHWIGFQQYFTFTAVDFYNHKLEAVEKESGWKVTQVEEFIFSVAVDFIFQAIAICIRKIIIHHFTSLIAWHK